MAIRNIVKDTDNYDTLHKKCRPVTEFNQKLWDLLDDMAETVFWNLSILRFWKPPAHKMEQKDVCLSQENTVW